MENELTTNPQPLDAGSVLVFGQRPASPSGRRTRMNPSLPEQPSLFG
jgi:hypothetical protein